jgi:hypothetical protein
MIRHPLHRAATAPKHLRIFYLDDLADLGPELLVAWDRDGGGDHSFRFEAPRGVVVNSRWVAHVHIDDGHTDLFHYTRCEGIFCHRLQQWFLRRTDMVELIDRMWLARAERARQASRSDTSTTLPGVTWASSAEAGELAVLEIRL